MTIEEINDLKVNDIIYEYYYNNKTKKIQVKKLSTNIIFNSFISFSGIHIYKSELIDICYQIDNNCQNLINYLKHLIQGFPPDTPIHKILRIEYSKKFPELFIF